MLRTGMETAVRNAAANKPGSSQTLAMEPRPFLVNYTLSKLRTHFSAEAGNCSGHAFLRQLGTSYNHEGRKKSHMLTMATCPPAHFCLDS
jgi:hypothetical protein